MYKKLLVILLCAPLFLYGDNYHSIPDPSKLDSSWWKYLESNDTFEENSEKLIQKLVKLRDSIDSEESPLLVDEIDRDILKIQELQSLKSEPFDYQPISPLYLESYTLSDWLAIAKKIRFLNGKMDSIRSGNVKKQLQIDLIRQNLDLNHIHYAILDTAPVSRLILGLEIMRLRLELEILEIQLKKNNKTLVLLTKDKEKLLEEREFADAHLTLSNINIEVAKEQLGEAKHLYAKAHDVLVASEKVRMGTHKEISPVERNLADFQALQANVNVELAQVRILYQEILLELVRENKDPRHIVENTNLWSKKLNIIHTKTHYWSEVVNSVEIHNNPFTSELIQIKEKIETALTAIHSTYADAKLLLTKLHEIAEEESSGYDKISLKFFGYFSSVSTFFESGFFYTLFHINDHPVTPWTLIRALLIIVFTIIVSRFLSRFVKNHTKIKRKIGKNNLYTISKILSYCLVIISFLVALFSIGFDMTNFIIIGGALGVGVGLGLQSIVNNFVSGISILFEKRVRVGDVIEIDKDVMGPIRSINIQNTSIHTFDGRSVVIPNSDFLTKRFINWTMEDNFLRLRIPFGVAYGTNIELVKQIIVEAAQNCPETIVKGEIFPPPKTWVTGFGESAINFELIVWVDFTNKTGKPGLQSLYYTVVERTLRNNNITIPLPQRDIRIKEKPSQ